VRGGDKERLRVGAKHGGEGGRDEAMVPRLLRTWAERNVVELELACVGSVRSSMSSTRGTTAAGVRMCKERVVACGGVCKGMKAQGG